MTKADLGLPSGNQVSTYQQNRDSAKLNFPTGFAFYSKGELRKAYEDLLWENHQLKNGSKISQLEKEADMLRSQLLIYQANEIKDLQGRISPVMKIAV